MNKENGKCVWFGALISAAINVILLIFYFLNSYLFESEVLIYPIHFASEILSSVLPVVIAASLSVIYTQSRLRNSFLWAILYAFINLIYVLPPVFLSAFDSQSRLLIAFLQSLISIVIAYLEYVLLFLLIIFIQRKFDKKERFL